MPQVRTCQAEWAGSLQAQQPASPELLAALRARRVAKDLEHDNLIVTLGRLLTG